MTLCFIVTVIAGVAKHWVWLVRWQHVHLGLPWFAGHDVNMTTSSVDSTTLHDNNPKIKRIILVYYNLLS